MKRFSTVMRMETGALGLEKLRTALGDLANVETPVDAAKFVRAHGPLRHSAKSVNGFTVCCAEAFRLAWKVKKTERDHLKINTFLDGIFTASDSFYGERPVLATDFASGTWQPQPRTMLDKLAVTLVKSRRMLHRCQRPGCARYFVSNHPRERYCKTQSRPTCGEVMREKTIKLYQKTHRDELNARRRKPRRKPRLRNSA